MSAGVAQPAGSSRELRLDPNALPTRFRAADANADGHVRLVEVHHEGVVVRRSVRGMPIAVALPVSAFLGVAVRLYPQDQTGAARVAVILEHRDPALSIPLFSATDSNDVLAEWQLWARTFAMPMLIVDRDGKLSEAYPHLGAVRVEAPSPRRRVRATLARRRPRILMRRKPGRLPETAVVHREREIIARN
jgi:Family of unknown function (DUF6101)